MAPRPSLKKIVPIIEAAKGMVLSGALVANVVVKKIKLWASVCWTERRSL